MSEETIEKTFNVTSPARLKLGNISGSVEILPGEDGVIQITATKREGSGDAKRTEIELSQSADGTVVAETHFTEGWWMWLVGSHPCPVDYVVKAPRACSLKVSGVSNSLLAEGFTGEFSINSVSGEITLRELSGPLRIHSVSGGVAGERISGALNVDTVSGGVRLTACDLPSAEAKTVSGSMKVETALSQGPYRFNTVSGELRLTVPPDTRCTAELHTVSGGISTDLPLSTNTRSNGRHVAEAQGGGVRVEMHSVSGGLRIGMPPGAEPVHVEAAPRVAQAAQPVDRRAVLERIERGEISVDEGLNLLRG